MNELSDVVAADVVAFDLRVFDPLAPSFRPSPTAAYTLTPVDPGFTAVALSVGAAPDPALFSLGAYVDLGYNLTLNGAPLVTSVISQFSGPPHLRSGTWLAAGQPNLRVPIVYDTWSTLYERDGLDQDNNGVVDQGSDGLEAAPINYVVDDQAERETSPPYPFPLQGVEAIVRMRELSSQQVRQASVVADFSAP
jgi:hypothetical protein